MVTHNNQAKKGMCTNVNTTTTIKMIMIIYINTYYWLQNDAWKSCTDGDDNVW